MRRSPHTLTWPSAALTILLVGSALDVRAGGVALTVEGQLIRSDTPETILAALGLRGKQEVPAAEEERMVRLLDQLGYRLALVRQGPRTLLRLTPLKVIRKIYISGNWPLFEEDILRRLRFRPGQRLPDGPVLAQAIARQEERMKKYLSREGYFEGSLRIKIVPADTGYHVNLEVELIKGRRFKIGEVVIRHRTRRATGEMPPLLSDEEIAKQFRHRILFYRTPFNTFQFSKDVEALTRRFQEANYPAVRIQERFHVDPKLPADRAVRIQLNLNPRKRIEVAFSGNKQISGKDLRRVLTFAEEGAYDEYTVAQSAQAIHRHYQGEGYLQARVGYRRDVGAQGDRITFSIEEGPRFRVASVTFSGNRQIPSRKLREAVKTRTFPFLGHLKLAEGGYVTDIQLQQDVERLETFYREQGFGEAQVAGEVAPHPELLSRPGALSAAIGSPVTAAGKAHVRFTIQEGSPTIVDRVTISGNRLLADRVLLSQLQLKPGRPFTEKALDLDKGRLSRIYDENGHPYAGIGAFEELSSDGSRVTVQFSVEENQRVRFGPIFIRGNFKTRASIIRRDLRFKEGDAYDVRLIEAAKARLRKRQIFNQVHVQLLGFAQKEPVQPVVIMVEERYDDHGAIELGVGGSTDNLLFGSVAYTNQNLFGYGTSLQLRGEVGMRIQSGGIRYNDPRLLGSTVILDIDGFIRNQITDRLGEMFTVGGSMTYTYELLPDLLASLRYEFRRINHKEEVVRPPGVDETRQVDVPSQTGGFGPSLVYDRRDNPLSPTRGYRVGASLLYASRYLGGWNDFLKLNLSGQAFLPLPWDISLAFSVRYDHGFPLGEVVLPQVERFYAGGDTTIRGFEQDRAWTERIEYPASPFADAVIHRIRPQGGNIRLLTNAELQFPIWKKSLLFGLPLMGAVFFDNGMVTNSFAGFKASDFRHSIGVAFLRIMTMVGSASFEWAFALDPQIGDPRGGRFHFNFGFVF